MASTAIQIINGSRRLRRLQALSECRVQSWLWVSRVWNRPLFFFHRSRLTALVVAAVLADAVRRLRLVAVRALAQAARLERVVRPAISGAGFRMSSFGIRHGSLFA